MAVPQPEHALPMVILLLKQPRRLDVTDLARAVAWVQGDEVASGVEIVADNPAGMSYFQWRSEGTTHHVGLSPDPYLWKVGVTRPGEPTRWMIRETVPPADPLMAEAWMSHAAWMYVDGLNFSDPSNDGARVSVVLRLAARLVDDNCLLLWLYSGNDEPRLVQLPTRAAVDALTVGVWPGPA